MEVAEASVIGIGGVARVGKDTLCKEIIKLLALKGIESQRIAFADELKKDLHDFLLEKSNLSVYTDQDSEKKLIRPILVEYGKLMRSLTKGSYWINKLEPLIESNINNNIVSIISDVRYENETKWVNSVNGGVSIHLKRSGIVPANEEESKNDPLVFHNSKIKMEFPTLSDEKISHYIQSHLNKNETTKKTNR